MALTFALDRSVVGATQLDALVGFDRVSFLEAAAMELAGDYATPGDWARQMAGQLDEDPEHQAVDRYTIAGADGPQFLMWYFTMSDDGSIYSLADGWLIGAHMVQGRFQLIDPETADEALVAELQVAFDTRPRT